MENQKKFKVVTLGCRTNQYESQGYTDQLKAMGYAAAGEDEPAELCIVNTCTVTHEGDAKGRQLIRRLHRDGNLTIVLIEHDMRVVFHLAERITVLDQGSLLAEGTPKEIAANAAVQAAYLGKAA